MTKTTDRVITINESKLGGITLKKGAHRNPEAGMCLMEAVSFVRGISHTDQPACVSPLLGQMGRSLNDVLPDDLRQRLVPTIPALPGTAGDGHDETRSYMALDWMIRTWLPAWLDLVPACREDAVTIRGLGRVVDLASTKRAGPVVKASSDNAAAARDAARDAAGAAARDATWAAAWDAAWAAAGAAAGAAARDATWAAAWDAARAAARAAAWAAARDATWAAAWDAARAAARAAARDAARAALAPTTQTLQESAIDLFDRMARIGDTDDDNG